MGKTGARPQAKVSAEWSPDLAYAVGLLVTDGNLSSDGRHMDFTSKDKQLVETFRSCLGIDNKIGRKTSSYTGKNNYLRVQFGDVLFYRWLEGVGLKPNKSKTLGALKVPDAYFFDFLRGCFDGDGSIYAYLDPRWHSSYMFYLTFVSASDPFLEWLGTTISRLTSIKGRLGESGKGVSSLRFAKKGTRILFDRMFYSHGLPCLGRKFTKAHEIFRINEVHDNA